MPTGHFGHISLVIDILTRLKPKSILDVGIGYGKYGMLAREYVDYSHFKQRQIKIDGIEAFAEYIQEGQRFYYDNIFNDDALKVIPTLGSYDIILLLDVLEHFSKEDGERILTECSKHGKNILICTPRNMGVQGAVYGNEYERHKYQWKKRNFKKLFPITFFYDTDSIIGLMGEQSAQIKSEIISRNRKKKLQVAFPLLYSFYKFFKR